MIRVDRHVRVSEEDLQPRASLVHVVQRADEGRGRSESVPLEAPIDPGEERIDVRFAVRQAMQPLGLAGKPLVADLRLDVVERADQSQALARALGIGSLGLK